jgi:hypothetical protein
MYPRLLDLFIILFRLLPNFVIIHSFCFLLSFSIIGLLCTKGNTRVYLKVRAHGTQSNNDARVALSPIQTTNNDNQKSIKGLVIRLRQGGLP